MEGIIFLSKITILSLGISLFIGIFLGDNPPIGRFLCLIISVCIMIVLFAN